MTRLNITTLLIGIFILGVFAQPAAAHYDPTLGRWLERDPIGYGDGMNPFQYVKSNPINHVDRNGWQAAQPQPPIQFPGGAGRPVDYPLRDVPNTATPADANCPPGGEEIPRTGGQHQNCAGRSCGVRRWIRWPDLGGPHAKDPDGCDDAQWEKAKTFVPQGCDEVSCDGVSTSKTRCKGACDIELVLFLYRWQSHQEVLAAGQMGPPAPIYSCDFHMIGRDPNKQKYWDSKQDQRNEFRCITDPEQSLKDAYPDRLYLTKREVVKRCFCCTRKDMGI